MEILDTKNQEISQAVEAERERIREAVTKKAQDILAIDDTMVKVISLEDILTLIQK